MVIDRTIARRCASGRVCAPGARRFKFERIQRSGPRRQVEQACVSSLHDKCIHHTAVQLAHAPPSDALLFSDLCPSLSGGAASGRTRGAPARGSATSTARRDTREAQPHRRMMRSVICWAIGAGATGAAGDDGMASAGRLKGRLRSQTFALVTCTVCFRLQQQQPRHEWKMSAMYECEFTSSTQWWC